MNRPFLYNKLKTEFGINGTILDLIRDTYQKTENTVRINGCYTDYFGSDIGLKQGDNLNPSQFGCYINGLLDELWKSGKGVNMMDTSGTKLNVLAYAGDLVVFANTREDLQGLLHIVAKWCERWKVLVNIDKTKIIHFRRKGQLRTNYSFHLGADNVEMAVSYKYLGVFIEEYLDINYTVDNLANAGSQALGQIIGKTRCNYDLGYGSFSTLFNSCVVSVLDYGSGAW